MLEPLLLHDGASEIMTIVLYNLSHETEDNNQLNTHTQYGCEFTAGIGK